MTDPAQPTVSPAAGEKISSPLGSPSSPSEATAALKPAFSVGLDLGAQWTILAVMDSSKRMPKIALNGESKESTPSVVAYPSNAMRLFGESADELSKIACACAPKLALLGAPWSIRLAQQCGATISEDMKSYSFGGQSYRAEQLLAFLMKSTLRFARSTLKSPEDCLVVSCPTEPLAYSRMRDAVAAAAAIIDVDPAKLLVLSDTEATAVYTHHSQYANLPKAEEGSSTFCIVNVGMCSSSVCIVKLRQGEADILAERGISQGSAGVDVALVEVLRQKLRSSIDGHPKSYAKLLREAEKAKKMLSAMDTASVRVDALKDDASLSTVLKREDLEKAAQGLIAELMDMITAVIAQSGVDVASLRLECIGGGWRSVVIQELLKKVLQAQRIGVSLDANLAVCEGCAIAGTVFNQKCSKDAVHSLTLKKAGAVWTPAPIQGVPNTDEWKAAEAHLTERDALLLARVEARGALESFILTTRDVCSSYDMDEATRAQLREELQSTEQWLWDAPDETVVEDLSAKLASVKELVAKKFPQVEAYKQKQLEIQRKKDEELAKQARENTEEREPKTDQQRLRLAQQRREQGVTLFKQEHFEEASTRFVQALALLAELYQADSAEIQAKKKEIALSCHLNVASCSVKLKLWRNAANNCSKALDYDPNSAKALYRRGQALAQLNELEDAKKDLERAKELSAGDAGVNAELEAVKKKIEAMKAKEKQMCARMFA